MTGHDGQTQSFTVKDIQLRAQTRHYWALSLCAILRGIWGTPRCYWSQFPHPAHPSEDASWAGCHLHNGAASADWMTLVHSWSGAGPGHHSGEGICRHLLHHLNGPIAAKGCGTSSHLKSRGRSEGNPSELLKMCHELALFTFPRKLSCENTKASFVARNHEGGICSHEIVQITGKMRN